MRRLVSMLLAIFLFECSSHVFDFLLTEVDLLVRLCNHIVFPVNRMCTTSSDLISLFRSLPSILFPLNWNFFVRVYLLLQRQLVVLLHVFHVRYDHCVTEVLLHLPTCGFVLIDNLGIIVVHYLDIELLVYWLGSPHWLWVIFVLLTKSWSCQPLSLSCLV